MKRSLFYLVFLAVLSSCVIPATANYWVGGGAGDAVEWSNPNNWDVGVPSLVEWAVIHNTTSYMPVISSYVRPINNLVPAWHDGGVTSTVTLQEGGIISLNRFILANGVSSNGTFQVNGGIFSSNTLEVGVSGTAIINLDGGQINTNTVIFAQDGVGSGLGTIDIEGGRLVLMGDQRTAVSSYITSDWIIAYNDSGRVFYDYNETIPYKTTATAVSSLAKAWAPVPGNDKPDAATDATLSWDSGDGAANHDVYLGTDFAAVNSADKFDVTGVYRGRRSGNSYDPCELFAEDTDYFWRIDEVTSGEFVTKGDVWAFKTKLSERDIYADTWVATDGLDRELPAHGQCGLPRNKSVGIYYWPLFGAHREYLNKGPFDVSKIIAENPFTNPGNPWADNPDFGDQWNQWWGEPEAGYFLSTDQWVIRRNISMLTDAGVDVVLIDVTNGFTYYEQYMIFCEVALQMKNEGHKLLQIAFFTHTESPVTVTQLYNELYSPNLYPELWFYWDGKPLVLGYPDGIDGEDPYSLDPGIENFFSWRKSWLNDDGYHRFPWREFWPQDYGYDEASDKPEATNVGAAGNAIDNIGRSHYNNSQPSLDAYHLPVGGTQEQGLYFSQQWERGLELDPEFLSITAWNGWTASVFYGTGIPFIGLTTPTDGYYFVDQYNAEYSRDCEPMKGGHTDNYYFQMIDGIRRYKGVRGQRTASDSKTISIDGSFADWSDVEPEFRDTIGDTFHRNHDGWGDAGPYINTTGRNDLLDMKVARDDDYVYFYAKTRDDITAYTDPAWMMLYINADQDHSTGWEGYDYVVNRSVNNAVTTTLQSSYDGDINSNLAARWKLDDGSGITAIDSSANGRNGTLVSDPCDPCDVYPYFHPSFGRLDGTIRFDGSDDHVEITGYKGVTGTQSRTLSAWIKTSTTNSIISWGSASGNGQKWLVRLDPANGALRVAVQGGSIVGDTDISDNQWHHVAVVFENDGSPDVSDVKLYADGVEESYSSVSPQAINTAAVSDVVIGAIDGSGYFDGFIDEVRIYERALSDSEVMMLAGGVQQTDGIHFENTNILYSVSGNELELRIPRVDIDQGSGTDPVAFDFHWADNMQNPYYIIEFAISGDSAPNRRFNYRYDTAVSAKACQKTFDDGNGNNMDLDEDCDLDIYDLALFADDWLAPHDLDSFADLAGDWLLNYLPDDLDATILLEDDFETGDFSSYSFQHSGNQNWIVTTDEPYQGTYSAKSGDIDDSQQTHLSLDVTVASDAVLSFHYRVSSESGWDYLYFHIDTIEKIKLAGDQPWMRASYALTPGTYTLKWSYTKDGSQSSYSDSAWIDDVKLITP